MCPVALPDDQIKHFADDGGSFFINHQVEKRAIPFSDSALMNELISIRTCAPAPDPIFRHLLVCSFDTERSLFTFTARRPKSHVVHEAVNLIVKALLAFPGAPYFDSMLDKPFDQEGRFIFLTAQSDRT